MPGGADHQPVARALRRRTRFIVEWRTREYPFSGLAGSVYSDEWRNADPTKLHENVNFAQDRAEQLRRCGLEARIRPVLQ